MPTFKERLDAAKVKAESEIRATIHKRRQSIAFAAPELQDEKWQELEDQVIHFVRSMEG